MYRQPSKKLKKKDNVANIAFLWILQFFCQSMGGSKSQI